MGVAPGPAYRDGTCAAVGDRVLIERGRTKAVVQQLWFTDEERAMVRASIAAAERIALGRELPRDDGPWAMLLSSPFGRVCWAFGNDNDPMHFVRRGTLDGARDDEGHDVDAWW